MRAYHFVANTLRDGSPVPADGEKLTLSGAPVLCERGLHASLHPLDALQYAPGPVLCLVDMGGQIVTGNDKLVGTERTIIARFDATDMLRAFARQCALDVIHLWDAPAVVRQYLKTGDETLRDASDAAWAAARAARGAARAARGAAWAASDAARAASGGACAASDAAWAASDAASAAARAASDAAREAARDAARDAQKSRFQTMVDAKFAEIGK